VSLVPALSLLSVFRTLGKTMRILRSKPRKRVPSLQLSKRKEVYSKLLMIGKKKRRES
jgi:hypothetical protein